jgi:hypothetical protein
VKMAIRVAAFVLGLGLLFVGFRKSHVDTTNQQNPGATNTGNPAEVLVVIGGFVTLMAFVPSQQTLGRWMSLKKSRKPQPAHFRRRRQRS